MSNICLINLQHKLNYEQLNKLANTLVRVSLEHHIGVVFYPEYVHSIKHTDAFKSYFGLSDSFMHCNCEFLDTPIDYNLSNIERCKKDFFSKYAFFIDMIGALKQAQVTKIDVYLSADGSVDDVNDFTVIQSSYETFLTDVFNSIIDNSNLYAYNLPTACYQINLRS